MPCKRTVEFISSSCRVTGWPFIFGLILPFAIIYVFNWVAFVIIMVKLIGRNGNETSTAKVIRRNVFTAVIFSLLFGLGWGVGLAATSSDVKEVTFFFQVVFSMFVGAQGILFLIFHGFRSNDFRRVWLCSKWKKKTKTSVLRKSTLSQKMGQLTQIPHKAVTMKR